MRGLQTSTILRKRFKSLALAAAFGAAGLLAGCNSFFDQSELGRGLRSERLVVPILSSIDPIDEGTSEFTGATEVKADDLKAFGDDYVISRNDLVSVSIFDLQQQGVETVRTGRISETGMLTLPLLQEPVKASGLTESQLQRAIASKYKEAGMVANAQVTVTVVEARGRTFNIMGSVARPGQYAILESDFRVLNALVQSGDVTFPAEYLYVIRKVIAEKPNTVPTQDQVKPPTTGPVIDPLAPKTEAPVLQPNLAYQEPAKDPLKSVETKPPETKPAATQPATRPGDVSGAEQKFIFIDGKPVLLTPEKGAATAPGAATTAVVPAATQAVIPSATQPGFEFGAGLVETGDERVIRVPLSSLRNGDLRYNVVVRPGDTIIIPTPDPGEFYMGGHVARPGPYSLTGRKITLKQAIISAGGLDPFAVLERTDVIRRIPGDREVFVRMNTRKVFEGLQPDIYLKHNDVVMVGTDFWVPFLVAARNAFRMTYGFGFLYDRNFAPAQEQRFSN